MRPTLIIIHWVFSVAMILCILFQTTKSEGLGGIIGGKSSSLLGGKSSTDLFLEKMTRYIAIGWFILCALLTWTYWH